MRDFQSKRVWRRVIYTPWTIGLCLIVSFLLVRSGYRLYREQSVAKIDTAKLEAEVAELSKRAESLSSSLKRLGTARGVEGVIREKFDVVKEGEGVIVILDAPTLPAAPKEEQMSFWQSLWQDLFPKKD